MTTLTPNPLDASGAGDTDGYRVEIIQDRPNGGMWHNGPNPCWVTVTHIPTGISARAFDRQQHKAREIAMQCVRVMRAASTAELPRFMERLAK